MIAKAIATGEQPWALVALSALIVQRPFRVHTANIKKALPRGCRARGSDDAVRPGSAIAVVRGEGVSTCQCL